MKTTLFISMAVLHLMAVATATAVSSPDGIAVIFIIDTRWSCGDDMAEFRTLARQGLGTTGPQDYIEILTAHSGRPRIRLAQTTYRGILDQVTAASPASSKSRRALPRKPKRLSPLPRPGPTSNRP